MYGWDNVLYEFKWILQALQSINGEISFWIIERFSNHCINQTNYLVSADNFCFPFYSNLKARGLNDRSKHELDSTPFKQY